MLDTCRIRKVIGNTTDTTTGAVTPAYGPAVYQGKCKIQRLRGVLPSTPDAGEHRWSLGPVELHVPVAGSAAIETGMVAEILTSVDPENVGRVFRVRLGDRKTFQSAIRLAVEEVTG